MRFNCSGRIKKVKFLALRTDGNSDPTFGVGRLQGDDNYYQVRHMVKSVKQDTTVLFEHHFRPSPPFSFKHGDVFALKQVDSLLMYNTDNTIELLRCSMVHGEIQMHNCETDHGYQPLVTIETGKNNSYATIKLPRLYR